MTNMTNNTSDDDPGDPMQVDTNLKATVPYSHLDNPQSNQAVSDLFVELEAQNDLEKLLDTLRQEIRKKDKEIQDKVNEIQKKDKEIQNKDNEIQDKDNEIQKKDNEIQDKDYDIQKKDREVRKKEKEILKKDNEIREKNNEIQELKQKNTELKDEASKYQFALGTATNLRLSDNDENNSVKLKNDIEQLIYFLEDYVTKCKGNVKINISKVQKLLEKYGSKTVITEQEQDKKKPLIRAVLQRHVIEEILKYAKEYFDNAKQYQIHDYGIEAGIHEKANELIDLAEKFAKERVGVDDTTKVLPIKLRQQIFGALGNRGFNDIIDDKNKFFHNFLGHFKSILNKEIGECRRLEDPKRKQEIEQMAAGIIQKVITLFLFRFKVQEPIVEYRWFECDDNIDPIYMKGKWDDDEIDNIVVDICYFPLIIEDFHNESTCHVYTPARIFEKYKQTATNGCF